MQINIKNKTDPRMDSFSNYKLLKVSAPNSTLTGARSRGYPFESDSLYPRVELTMSLKERTGFNKAF
jgi:hypothetical protein